MGDMKTPDFDDLLAAFDIPDIETIESSPEEENSDTEGAPGGKDKTTYPTDQSDVPAVSVIVKNTVRTDIPGTEKEKRVHNDFKTQNESTEGDSQAADPELCNIEGLSKVSNGLKGTDANIMSMSNIEPVPQQLTGPLSTTFEHENKTNDTTVPLQPSQDAKDCIKPLFNTKLSAIGSISPVLSPSQVNNPNTSTPSPYNIKTQLNNFNQSDEEDSDPDLEGALVIQESPESAESAVPPKRPKLKHKPDVNLYFSDSTEKKSNSIHTSPASLLDNSDLKNEAKTVTPSSQAAPLPCPPPLVKDEKYPEHVIDERDSPESPPPSETGMLVPKRSPELPQTDTECTEQRPKECEASKEDTAETTEEMNSEIEEKFISTVTDPPSLGPVKVKMKRSARAVSAKKGGRTKTEAVKTIKAESDTRPRRKSLKQSKEEKATAGKGAKIKLSSAPEISLKTTAKVTAAGITLRSLGQKTLPGGVTLPLPSLLPPLSGSSRPASIVNSTGAIISKSQTNLVEAFNRILNNKNLLPSYKPDLASSRQAEWGLSLPAQGYRCLECGDSFALEQSLARHYDRRSLRIEVTCNHCAKRLAFFNKCSLLLHAREHKERGLIMQCSHLVMKPVPVEQMIGPHEPAAAAVSSVLSNVNPNATSVRKTEEVQYGNHKCPECQTQFSGAEEVAKHFQELKSQTTTCTECSPPMLLSNSCCAAAHQRIHLNSPPHVCPECGGTSKPPTFKTHLEETCFHFARRIGYRCSSCLVVFGGINSVKSHIQQAHCDMFQKCPICPMAFKSAPSIQNHITAQHPTLTDTQAISIFKCVMCDTVFTNKNLLYVHFDTHLANQKVHVFKCPECPKQFSVRSSLMDHLKTHHTKVKQESPLLLSQSQPSVKMESSEGEEWSTPAKEVTPQKTRKHFPCTKCESSFSTTSNLRRHIRDKHKTVARSFRCQFCTDMKKTFSSRAMLEKHIKLRHSLEAGDQDFLMEGGDEADSSSEQDGGSVFRRRRRAAIKSEQEEESVHEVRLAKKWRSSSALSSDPQIEKGFRCAPCGYTCEEQAEFLEHISQHRKGAGGSSQQCLQCGVCFTSNHSLSRHRFIVHRVRDQESQEITNTCPAPSPNENHDDNKCVFSAPESPALSQGKDSEGALACKVCGKHFEKATDLNTHFRTHGMAFINARNTAKTT